MFKTLIPLVKSKVSHSITGNFKRILFRNVTEKPVFNYSVSVTNTENGSLHRILETIPGYQNHIVPLPKYCASLNHYNNCQSDVDKCNCTDLCRLSNKPLTVSVISNSGTIFDVREFFSNTKIHFSTKELKEQSFSVTRDAFFQIQNLSSLPMLLTDMEGNNLKLTLQCVSDMELTQIMIYSSLLPFAARPNLSFLIKLLDSECCKRYLNWTTEQQLYVSDIWFHLGTLVSKTCFYNLIVINTISKKLHDLTISQIIHLLFIINLRRNVDLQLMMQIEKILEAKIDSFSLEELAIVAIAFFKTSRKISSDIIISEMIDSITRSLPNVKQIVSTSIFKSLRYSYNYKNEQRILTLLSTSLKHRVWKTNFPVAIHLCLLASSHGIYMPELLDAVMVDLCKFENIRLKDMSRVLLVASQLNHVKYSTHSHLFQFFHKEFETLKRRKEIEEHPHPYMSCLLCLAYAGVFYHSELNKVFSKRFYSLLEARVTHGFLRDLATLDYIVEIDAPGYSGNRLDTNKRFDVFQERRHQSETEGQKSFRKCVFSDVSTVLQDVFNQEVLMVHLLPYMDDPVFLLIFDNDGQLCKPTEDFMKLVSEGLFARPTNEHKWVVIWPLLKIDLQSTTGGGLSGYSALKERHLKKLGYDVVTVPNEELNYRQDKHLLMNSLKCYLKESCERYLKQS